MSFSYCGYDCILSVTNGDPCNYQTKCLCTSSNYLNNYRNCVNKYCDAAGAAVWISYGENTCAAVGVSFSASGYSATVSLTAAVYQTSALTAIAGQASSLALSAFQFASSLGAGSVTGIPSTTQTISGSLQPTTPASVQTSQDSSGGLGIGAVIGIAIGAVVVVVLAILAAFLLWRRRRKQPKYPPPGITRAPAVTTTNALYNPGYYPEQATYLAKTDVKPYGNTELVAAVPSEVPASTVPPSYNGPFYHSAVEADSTQQNRSHFTSPTPGMGSYSPEQNHELSSTPYVRSHSTSIGYPASAAQELSSSPPAVSATAFPPAPHASAVGSAVNSGADEAEDKELDRMKAEIEAVRIEKDHVMQLRALEERERELSRKIVERELSKGGGSRS